MEYVAVTLVGILLGAAVMWIVLRHGQKRAFELGQAEVRPEVTALEERLNRTSADLLEERGRVGKCDEELQTLRSQLNTVREENAGLHVQTEANEKRIGEILGESNSLQAKYDAQVREGREQATRIQELTTLLEEERRQSGEKLELLKQAEHTLTERFKVLANEIFDEKGKAFTSTSKESIDILLKPFREQIDSFQKRINEVHDASISSATNLNSEIKRVLEIGMKMSEEANNLSSALKGDSQQRGAWGEAQLRRTLEMSGLVEDAHFEAHKGFKDADGRKKETDYLIKLPDNKHIIIDSKVSLVAYDRAVGASSPEEYQIAMAEHIKSVRKHIDDLSSKDYTNLIGVHSPSFVLMFMPIEAAYIEALKYNKDLFEYGYKKGIVLVSHTTLIPILRTVSNLWMIENSNTNAREISEQAGDIYNQVCLVAERLSHLGGTLNTVSNHYNSAVTALAGKQGLYGKVERFNQLSTKVTKTLPSLQPSHLDFERERLALILEPIEEPEEPSNEQEDKQSDHNYGKSEDRMQSSE